MVLRVRDRVRRMLLARNKEEKMKVSMDKENNETCSRFICVCRVRGHPVHICNEKSVASCPFSGLSESRRVYYG